MSREIQQPAHDNRCLHRVISVTRSASQVDPKIFATPHHLTHHHHHNHPRSHRTAQRAHTQTHTQTHTHTPPAPTLVQSALCLQSTCESKGLGPLLVWRIVRIKHRAGNGDVAHSRYSARRIFLHHRMSVEGEYRARIINAQQAKNAHHNNQYPDYSTSPRSDVARDRHTIHITRPLNLHPQPTMTLRRVAISQRVESCGPTSCQEE